MITVGKRPVGCSYSKARVKDWKDVQVIAYIQSKSGEYDKIEREIMSDPWLDGYELRSAGVSIDAIKPQKSRVRNDIRNEWHELRLKGWKARDAEIRATEGRRVRSSVSKGVL